MEVVTAAWLAPQPVSNPFRLLDQKFRMVATDLKRWSSSKVGSIRLQLAMAKEVILCFDEEQEKRQLQVWEQDMHNMLKGQSSWAGVFVMHDCQATLESNFLKGGGRKYLLLPSSGLPSTATEPHCLSVCSRY